MYRIAFLFNIFWCFCSTGQTTFEYSAHADGSDAELVKSLKKIRNINEVEYLKIDGYTKKEFPTEVFDFKDLQALLIWNSNIEIIPAEIISLRQLTYLDFTNVRIQTIPSNLDSLMGLEKLIIYGCQNFKYVPKSVWQLKNLKYLDMSSSDQLLLDSIRSFPQIEKLIIRNNPLLSKLPEGIEKLTALNWLGIGGLNIDYNQELKKLKELNSLGHLEIAFSNLDSFPESLFDLFQLEEIYARGNNFTHFPESFRKISGLKKFDLSLNKTKIKHSERDQLRRMLPNCEINW